MSFRNIFLHKNFNFFKKHFQNFKSFSTRQKFQQNFSQPPPSAKESLKVFKNVVFNEEGKYLILHHEGASKYYKMNILFLVLFFGFSFRNYKYNPAIFMHERLGQLYLALIAFGIFGMLIFGNRHIRSLYLLPSGREISIETYSFFGLIIPKEKRFDISQLYGSRAFLTPKLNVYQLEYKKESNKWTKMRSFFYRPEFVSNSELWKEVRQGNSVITSQHIQTKEEKDMEKRMKKKSEALKKYR